MVTVSDYKKKQNAEGKEFYLLQLNGDLEMVLSKSTGNYYATAKKATITSTFKEHECKALIGKQLPGVIVKKECEPYEFNNPETGEIITLHHRYGYAPDENQLEKAVFQEMELA